MSIDIARTRGTTDPGETTMTVDPDTGTGDTDANTSTGEPVNPCETIELTDPVLDAAIRMKFGVLEGPIPTEEAAGLISLDNDDVMYDIDNRIETLAGLQCFPDLETLALDSHDISDLSPLAPLVKLKFLELSYGNPIVDIGPLAGLEAAGQRDGAGRRDGEAVAVVGTVAAEHPAPHVLAPGTEGRKLSPAEMASKVSPPKVVVLP